MPNQEPGIKVYKNIHLPAQSIGLAYEDEYKACKKGRPVPRQRR